MDNYIEEISSIVKLPFNEIIKDIKLILVGDKALYICNYIKILDYSNERLILKIPKDTLEIEGKDLTISQINKGEIIIKGKLASIAFGDMKNEKDKIK